MTTPERIQQEMAQTRRALSMDVNALGDKISPSHAVHRKMNRVRGKATSLRERVMGSPDTGGVRHLADVASERTTQVKQEALGAKDELAEAAQQAGAAVSSAASEAGDMITSAPANVRRQAQGNPLAAGLIAFGTGWLLSSLLPASSAEQQLGSQVREQARDVAGPVKDKAAEIADDLRGPAQQAAQRVAETAKGAASETAEEASDAARQVTRSLRS